MTLYLASVARIWFCIAASTEQCLPFWKKEIEKKQKKTVLPFFLLGFLFFFLLSFSFFLSDSFA